MRQRKIPFTPIDFDGTVNSFQVALEKLIADNKRGYIKLVKARYPSIWNFILTTGVGLTPAEKFFNILKTNNIKPLCYCGNDLHFTTYQGGYRQHCSHKCRSLNPVQQAKAKSTNLAKYGEEIYVKSKDFRLKNDTVVLEKYGVSNVMQVNEVKEKVKHTMNSIYGVNCGFQIPRVKESVARYLQEQHGVHNWSQIPEIFMKQQKSCFRSKTFLTPSGKSISIRGYESVLLAALFQKFNENLIFTSATDMPRIWYFNSAKNKRCKYYPDVFIPSLNLVLEVKSTYTYKKDFLKNTEKQKGCLELGLDFTFVICDANSILRIEGVDPFQ